MENTSPPAPLPKAERGMHLTAEQVRRLEQLLGGDPVTEGHVLIFIKSKFGARNLQEIPEKTAQEICRRPADFLRAVKQFCMPELAF